MNAKPAVLICGLVATLALLGACYSDTPTVSRPDDSIVAQGYPPPQSPTPSVTPTPTITPTADASGYMATPSGIPVTVTSLTGSPYADLLSPLQTALDSDDAPTIGGLAYSSLALRVGGASWGMGGQSAEILGSDVAGYLTALFNQGTNARIQGYFETGDTDVPCVEVVVHRFVGTVAYPTVEPTPTGTYEAHFIENPSEFPLDAATWNFCKLGSDWHWNEWRHGEYYPMVDTLANMWTNYFVIRP